MDKNLIAVAEALRAERPPVMAGTNVVINADKRRAWYAKVNDAIKAAKLPPGTLGRFCDIAGVPD